MTAHRNRYPGAQPFTDDDVSRKVFFGRETASRTLTDKILANRVVIVYARSGLGKTSLLQAGVAPKLREEACVPLFVRVNDTRCGPFSALLETIPGEARRQHVEYVPGQSESLWSFFKTAEFWRDDLLLTPVLILDQFEELFTLQGEQARAHFLNELSYLCRGVRPPSGEDTSPGRELSEHPPAVHIVLSLREDHLGFLEEAAEHIPQIMDARFRLAPLDMDAAREAIVGPAAVTDPGLETRPFALDPTTITAILDYLSQARTRRAGENRRYVEPFQLQLICRRMEQVADARQQESPADLTITMADLGGEAGLTQTLRDFYGDAIGSVPDRRGRRASRRLCEEYLISPEGRRLSLEESELRRQLGLPAQTLDRLVASRLLRSESRSESTYYELSHDALVEPILASRRAKAQVVGMLGIGAGALLFLASLAILLIISIAFAANPRDFDGDAAIGLSVVAPGLLGIVVSSAILLRGSARLMLRYERARQPAMTGPEMSFRSGFVAGLPVLIGGAIVALAGLLFLLQAAVVVLGPVGESVHRFAQQLAVAAYVDHRNANGIGLDTLVYLVAAVATLTVGGRLCRWGVYRLAGIRGGRVPPVPRGGGRSAVLYAASRMLVGGITLLSAATLAGFDVLTVQCDSLTPGSMPRWLPSAWFNKLAVDCMTGYPDGVVIDLTGNFLLLTVLLFVAIPTLRRGIAATQAGSLRAALWHTGADMPLVVNTSVDDRGRQPSPRSSRSDEPSTRSIRTSMTTRRGFTRGVR